MHRDFRSAISELEIIQRWTSGHDSPPLILISPLGTGKSALIESLALTLQPYLKRNGGRQDIPLPAAVAAYRN